MTAAGVRELCSGVMTKAELAKAIIEDCGCAKGSAYRYIKHAMLAGKIRFNEENRTFTKA